MAATRSEVETIIAERIAVDPAFRGGDVIGFNIPDSIQVVLHEESLTSIHLTIPASETLTDAELDLVAGGADWNPTPPPGGWGADRG